MDIVKYASRVRNAAIAQPVERILGKDEVASSNLASSSRKCLKSNDFGLFCCLFVDIIFGQLYQMANHCIQMVTEMVTRK